MTKLPIIDTHAHLYMEPFARDLAETIERAKKAGVQRIVNIGVDRATSHLSIQMAEAHEEFLATVGFHPHDAEKMRETDIDIFAEMVRHPKVVGIGELGLDFFRNYSSRNAQFQALEWQLSLAKQLSLPIVVHSRAADTEMTAALRRWTASLPATDSQSLGVIHCFNSDAKVAQTYVEMGFHIAVGAYIGYPTSAKSHEAIRLIPPERLVVETDCPFLPPQAYRGKRNEPAYLPMTIQTVAAIRRQSPQEIAKQTTQNACRLFRLPQD